MSYAVGVDVPLSQMPAGMAFDGSGASGGGGGLLGSIGSGFLKGITGGIGDLFGGSESEESGGYGSPRGGYVDDTKRMMQQMLLQSMANFDPSRIRSTIGTV
jgi:hypothetical protein